MSVMPLRIFVWLMVLLIIYNQMSCIQTMTEPAGVTNSMNIECDEENAFNNLYSEMKLHIDKANSEIMELYYYDWVKLGSIGWITGMPGLYVPDEQSYSWVNGQLAIFQPLSDELPGKMDAVPYIIDAEKCLHLASSIWSDSPYKQKLSLSGKMDQSFLYRWKIRCKELILHLTELEKQLADYKFRTITTSIRNMENILNRWEWVKENYLPFLRIKSIRYIEFIDLALTELAASRKQVVHLMAWEFASLQDKNK